MVNYFSILELAPDASKLEIKKAYRRLAMRYHPDRNKDTYARAKFIAVNRAYDFLSDDNLRFQLKRRLNTGFTQEELQQRKEALYRQWVRKKQEKAKRRAAFEESSAYHKFSQSAIYKIAMVVSSVYNYIFLIVGLLIIVSPIFNYFMRTPLELQRNAVTVFEIVFPVTVGTLFTFGIYYFLFRNNPDKEFVEEQS